MPSSGIGAPLIPNQVASNQATTIIATGEGGNTAVNTQQYTNEGQYQTEAEKRQADVYLQQVRQNLPAIDESLKEKETQITSSEQFKKDLADANAALQASRDIMRDPATGSMPFGFWSELYKAPIIYQEKLTSARSDMDSAFKQLQAASTIGDINIALAKYNESRANYEKVVNTDYKTIPDEVRQAGREAPSNYMQGPRYQTEQAAIAAQTANVLGGLIAAGPVSRSTAEDFVNARNFTITASGGTPDNLQASDILKLNPAPTSVKTDFLSTLSGYTPVIGDSKTKAMVAGGMDLNIALETQRQQAVASGDTRAARFYQNELDKSLQNNVRLSSGYHFTAAQTGVNQPPNPFENMGDVSLAILKGGNPRDDFAKNYAFSPDVQRALATLPRGKGTQENAWEIALGRNVGGLNYLPALGVLKGAEKSYGPYGTLGSYDQSGKLIPVPAENIARLPEFYRTAIEAMNKPVVVIPETRVSAFDLSSKQIIPSIGAAATSPEKDAQVQALMEQGVDYDVAVQKVFGGKAATVPGFSFTGLISRNVEGVGTQNAPYTETRIEKANDYLSQITSRIPLVGWAVTLAGESTGIIPAIETAFPTSSFKQTPGFSLSNIPGSMASNVLVTTEVGAPITRDVYVSKTGAPFVQNKPPENAQFGERNGNEVTFLTKPISPENATLLKDYEGKIASFNTDKTAFESLLQKYESNPAKDEKTYNILTTQLKDLQNRETEIVGMTPKIEAIPPIEYETVDLSKETVRPQKTTYKVGQSDVAMAESSLIGGKIIPDVPVDENAPAYVTIPSSILHSWSQNPSNLVFDASQGVGMAKFFSGAENIILKKVATSAEAGSTAGRLFSTPSAISGGRLLKTGLGVGTTYLVASDIAGTESNIEKGQKISHLLPMLGGGVLAYEQPTLPENKFWSRTMAGERKLPPTASMRNYLITKLEKGLASNPEVFEDISTIFRGIRGQEPQPGIRQIEGPNGELTYTDLRGFTEPNIAEAKTIGPERAGTVREAMLEDQGVLKGSVVVPGQVSGMKSGIEAARPVKDVDYLSANKENFENILTGKGETTTGMDIKSPEKGYPEVFGQEIVRTPDIQPKGEGYYSKLLNLIRIGEPIRPIQGEKLPFADEVHVAGKVYRGKEYTGVGEEQLNAQFARKAQAFQEDLIPGNSKQYRIIKDSRDFNKIGIQNIEANQALKGTRVGTPTKELELLKDMGEKKFTFDYTPKQAIPEIGAKVGVPFKKTMTFNEMWEVLDKMPKSRQKELFPEEYGLEEPVSSVSSIASRSGFAGLISRISPSASTYSKNVSSLSPSRSSISTISRASPPSVFKSSVSGGFSIPSFTPSPVSRVSGVSGPSSPPSGVSGVSGVSSVTSPPSPSFSSYYSSFTSPSSYVGYSPSPSPKVPPPFAIPFMSPGGSGTGGGKRGTARGIPVINPLRKLTVATAITAARFTRGFGGGNYRTLSNVRPQGRGNLRPIAAIKRQSPRKNVTASSISANISGMFGNKKGKKNKRGMVF